MGLAVAEAKELEHVQPGVHAGHYGHVAGRFDLEARIGEVDGECPVGCEELVGDRNVVGHDGWIVPRVCFCSARMPGNLSR